VSACQVHRDSVIQAESWQFSVIPARAGKLVGRKARKSLAVMWTCLGIDAKIFQFFFLRQDRALKCIWTRHKRVRVKTKDFADFYRIKSDISSDQATCRC
jgi:hypothetical protein